jgi:predicted nucleic acid-binding protein
MTSEDASQFYELILGPLWKVMPDRSLYLRALSLQERYGYHFYDAMIVAAALSAGCTTLYTEDLQHGQQIEGLRMVNPFLASR